MDDAEEQLVVRARGADRAAFEDLVRATARGLYARLYLETNDPHRAEDLVQETYLKAWKNIRQCAGENGFRSWLYAIGHSVAIDSARRQTRQKRDARRQTAADVDQTTSPADSPAEAAGLMEDRQRAVQLLRNLPADYREVLAMRYLLGQDYEAIGRQLGLSNGSLRGLLNRGLALLRDQWNRRSV